MYHYKNTLKANAQKLRQMMTPEEMHLWLDFLKNLPITVKRQACIANYIVDFYIAKEKIVIELDGKQHTAPENKEADQKRDDCSPLILTLLPNNSFINPLCYGRCVCLVSFNI